MLYKSIPTGSQSHTGEYLRQLVKIPIERFGAKNYLAVISDNGSDVKLMRKLISQEYPHIYTFGCAAHGLNLLIQDICKLKTVNNILNRCKEIVKEVIRSHAKKHKFREYNQNKHMLRLPVSTRWYSVVVMLESLISGRNCLLRMVLEESDVRIENIDNISAIKESEDQFWMKTNYIRNLLKSITNGIAFAESDETNFSEVPEIWLRITTAVKQSCTNSILNQTEISRIEELLKKRRNYILTPIHFVANLINPKFKGRNLETEDHIEAFTHLGRICTEIGTDLSTYLEFSANEGKFQGTSLWTESSTKNPILWWKYFKSFADSRMFSDNSAKLLSIPCTTASVEHHFSLQSRIHSKDRNRLTNDKVEKILTIQQNSKYLMKDRSIIDIAGDSLDIQEVVETFEEYSDSEERTEEFLLPEPYDDY